MTLLAAPRRLEAGPTLRHAQSYVAAGLSVIPIRLDGSKAPALRTWTPYTLRLPTPEELLSWFAEDRFAIAIVGGAVSGNLERLDFDDFATFNAFMESLDPDLAAIVRRLPRIETPRPGIHLYYRCAEIQTNQVLAYMPPVRGPDGKIIKKVRIETRGIGGYTIAPGSPLGVHELGRPYEHVGGQPLTEMPTITPQERHGMWQAARAFNAWVEPAWQHRNPCVGTSNRWRVRPGDDYAARTSWAKILEPHGWRLVRQTGDVGQWRRPGKVHGISATTDFVAPGVFYCFTANGAPFEERHAYDKFTCYSLLEHADDWKAAVRALMQQGFGEAADGPVAALDSPLPELRPPRLSARAFHGPAGELVQAVAPHSEADPAALLVQVLTAFGSAIGRTAHFVVEKDRHYLNLFVVLVGATSKGRKGTSWGQVREFFALLDPVWTGERIQGGLSSGEGLIWAVRDPLSKREPIREKGRVVSYQEVEADAGVADKRLLCCEQEFAAVLKVMDRQGNTLSTLVRQAWETGRLRALTKNSPAQATDAHISLIGHVTAEELRRHLRATEQANGFGNRILWVLVRRSKSLPEGGRFAPEALGELRRRFEEALAFARTVGEMHFDTAAREHWFEIYDELAGGRSGMAGAMTARAEAQTRRLACLYALLGQSRVVCYEHLEAALALWRYAEESVRYIFGESLGDPLADDLLEAFRANPAGLTRTQLRELVGTRVTGSAVTNALRLLHGLGLARGTKDESGGRPIERWCALGGREEKQEKEAKAG
jgi:hypothetical protein